jgi:hypothetical protein
VKSTLVLIIISCTLCVAGILVMKTTIDPMHRSLGELAVLAGLVLSALPLVGVVLARQAERRARKRDFPSAHARDDR